ncbi:MAG: Gfo/Idh/MocA family protein [Hyphomicrobiaceae bacterium]
MVKVAIIETSHWHVPLYIDGLMAADIDVVAISDATRSSSSDALASRLGARTYDRVSDLLKHEQIDFAFAFGRHCDLPQVAKSLIQAGVPFSVEKPCGMCSDDVAEILNAAEAANLYVAVPYIYRVSDLCHAVEDLEGGLPSDFTHLSIRFIAGPPERYETWNCGWMLDPETSGGGALMNVGGHFLDLFRLLTGKPVTRVSAVMSSATHGAAVEDFAVVTLQAENVIGIVEVGYTFPGVAPGSAGHQREFSFTARSSAHYLRSCDGGIAVSKIDGNGGSIRTIGFEPETDLYYPLFVKQVLDEWRQGLAPSVGLREALEAMKILEAAYASARLGGTPISLD